MGKKSYALGIKDLSEARTNGKKATRLCPCGYLGHYSGKCRCTPDQVARYRGRISGPLLDRIDLLIEVPAVPQDDLMRQTTQGEQSSTIRQRTERARNRQISRQSKPNNHLSVKETEAFCLLDTPSKNLLKQAIDRLNLSARAYHRILRVARTIADLSNQEKINNTCIAEAIQYRRLDKN